MRRLRNTGVTPLRLPSGRIVQPGETFPPVDVSDALVQAWLTAGSVRFDAPKKPSKKEPE